MTEVPVKLTSGWAVLPWTLLSFVGIVIGFIANVVAATHSASLGFLIPVWPVALVGWIISLFGYIVVNPNEARVILLFGQYMGTLRETGFHYGNPFYSKTRVTLRTRTFETGMGGTPEVKDPQTGTVLVPSSQHRQPSKVNDKDGTPIEIAAVVVWRVVNPASAVLDVQKYEEFVTIQSDAALRNLASRYSYDGPETDEHSHRGHIEEVAGQLKIELQERMQSAGVEILEARISYLAYAPEIAAAMLQRQQASAIIAARQKIVEGAVGMVEHALDLLQKNGVVELDAERRTAMVSNLLVVLCGHSVPQPVLNTGTIYH